MPLLRYIIFIASVIFILSFITVNATTTAVTSEQYPEFIPIIHAPCCLECSYSLPYCYNYIISNIDDGIKVEEWKLDSDGIKGRATANIDAKLIIKMCFQLSLTSAYVLIDEELDLQAEFDFNVGFSLRENSEMKCIDEKKSSISFSSFALKGDLTTDPIPEIAPRLTEDILSSIKDSVYKTAYIFLDSNLLPGDKENIYCQQPQNDAEASTSPCPCY